MNIFLVTPLIVMDSFMVSPTPPRSAGTGVLVSPGSLAFAATAARNSGSDQAVGNGVPSPSGRSVQRVLLGARNPYVDNTLEAKRIDLLRR